MTESNKIILKKANAAVSKGNYEEFLQYCTDDTKWTFIGDQVLNGKEAVRRWMLNEYIEPPQNDVKNLIAENDYLTVLGHIAVKNKNGKTNQYSYCDVWRFRDGKMAELMAFVVESSDLKDDKL
ncbi:MAG: nuclear transport factor 2 family protein [Balneolales bacterium]